MCIGNPRLLQRTTAVYVHNCKQRSLPVCMLVNPRPCHHTRARGHGRVRVLFESLPYKDAGRRQTVLATVPCCLPNCAQASFGRVLVPRARLCQGLLPRADGRAPLLGSVCLRVPARALQLKGSSAAGRCAGEPVPEPGSRK